tara:strand:- start:998 stop:1288 length:291 start_codon:yes stop_codon:yes gene_type:complete
VAGRLLTRPPKQLATTNSILTENCRKSEEGNQNMPEDIALVGTRARKFEPAKEHTKAKTRPVIPFVSFKAESELCDIQIRHQLGDKSFRGFPKKRN